MYHPRCWHLVAQIDKTISPGKKKNHLMMRLTRSEPKWKQNGTSMFHKSMSAREPARRGGGVSGRFRDRLSVSSKLWIDEIWVFRGPQQCGKSSTSARRHKKAESNASEFLSPVLVLPRRLRPELRPLSSVEGLRSVLSHFGY